MKIVVTGSSGLVGKEVVGFFKSRGCRVVRLVRHEPVGTDEAYWNPESRRIDSTALEGAEAIIHLAGANIAGKRWTLAYKDQILSSRVEGTKFLAEAISVLKSPPKVFISTSGIGYYGNQVPEKELDEFSPAGRDFLANVCVEWEKAALPAIRAGVRTVILRFGVVLSKKGGALGKMLPVFRMGAGGKIGNGRQMMSWIALPEIPEIMNFVMNNVSVSGPVNTVSAFPERNAEFTAILGKALKRPTVLPLPAVMVRLMFGEMGEALLLGGVRVLPRKLLSAGYQFKNSDLLTVLKAEFQGV